MPSFKCENPIFEKLLSELHDLILEYGGYVNDKIIFLEEQGELSILSSLPKENTDELIVLPDACLPRIDDFLITVQDNKLLASPKSSDVRESHVVVMGLMMDGYNITNKLAKHRETNPWLALKQSPVLMQKLYEARYDAPKIKQFYEKYESKKDEELLMDTFIGSRTLALNPGGGEKSPRCLMPLIDFVNHYFVGSEFQVSNDQNRTISIRNFVPVTGSQECFVRYTILDALDSFLLYNFVDLSVPFVRSVPLQFDLHELSGVQVQACVSQLYRGTLPAPVNDLRMYIPYVMEGDDSVMQLSHLLIPGATAPLALRRVLAFYIRGWKPGLSLPAVKKIILNAEELIVHENTKYYMNLSSFIETTDDCNVPAGIVSSIKILVDSQLKKLQQYQMRIQNVGGWDRILGDKPRLF